LAHEIVGSFAGKEKEQGITIMIVFPAQPVEVAQRVHVVRHEPQGWKEAHGTEDESSPPQSPTCTVPESACRSAWARLMAKVYEVNPLVCPRCFSKMQILAEIIDPGEVKKTATAITHCA
jgi:hypothetical protein